MKKSGSELDRNIRVVRSPGGVLTAWIDMPGRAMNVFSMDLMDSMERLIDVVERDATVCAVVVTSGKRDFIAGADLEMVRAFAEAARTEQHERLLEKCGRLGRLFRRIEVGAKPYVAAINGLALGGGLELCLACQGRVASDDDRVALGLPEVRLGLLPGAGGTQRLPRRVGLEQALKLLLTGNSLSAEEAAEVGLVDRLAPRMRLLEVAEKLALELCERRAADHRERDGSGLKDTKGEAVTRGKLERIAQAIGIGSEKMRQYPAYGRIMDAVAAGWHLPLDEALGRELEAFIALIRDPVAERMVRTLFLDRKRSLKRQPQNIEADEAQVAVLGRGAEAERALALLRAAGARIVSETDLRPNDIAVLADAGNGARIAIGNKAVLRWLPLRTSVVGAGETGLWVSERNEHGLGVEIVVAGEGAESADAGVVLAKGLRASAILETTGSTCVLGSLADIRERAAIQGFNAEEVLLAVTLHALALYGRGAISDRDIADAAAVVAGLMPAYTGGMFKYARELGLQGLRREAQRLGTREAKLFHWSKDMDCGFERLDA